MDDFLNKQGIKRNHNLPLIKGSPEWDMYFPKKKEKVDKTRKYDEFNLQKSCVSWFRRQYPYLWRCLYMIKNDGIKNRIQNEKTGVWFSPQANRDKLQGLVPGVGDMYFMLPNRDYSSWSIEFKTDIGTQNQEQIIFGLISKVSGKKYTIIRKLDEFIYEMTEYMKTVSQSIINEVIRLEDIYQKTASEKTKNKLKNG